MLRGVCPLVMLDEQGRSIENPVKLIVPMLERFITPDRAFARAKCSAGTSADKT
nr:DUF2274 domain-containing protein [Mesorhizobium sp. B2-3-12]